MTSLPVKLIVFAAGLAFVLAAATPVDAAKARKHKKVAATQTTVGAPARYRDTSLFRPGPVYHGPDYIGDDPDPFIRLQLYRDLGARYGGDN